MAGSIEQSILARRLCTVFQNMESNSRSAGLPKGSQKATVKEVDDPQERGRVRVLFDAVNSDDIPSVEGAESLPREGSDQGLSHWIDVCPAFKGRQPKGLIGKRVLIMLPHSQYQFAVLNDVIHDTECLTQEAASRYEIPSNSPMSRLPIYASEELPDPCQENHGCIVIEEGGPMSSDWLCVCLKRSGKYFWVRHVDLSHGHAGGDDGTQPPSAAGIRQSPVYAGTTSSHVFPSTAFAHIPKTSFSERPTGNPFGDAGRQYPPPKSDLQFPELRDFELLSPDPAVAVDLNAALAGYLPSDATISGFNATSFVKDVPVLSQERAIEAFNKAQAAYNALSEAQRALTDPYGYLKDKALTFAKGIADDIGLPPGTEKALDFLSKAGNSLKLPPWAPTSVGGVLSSLRSLSSSFLP